MKTMTIVAISLAAAGLAWAAEAEVIPSVGLVHVDEKNADTYYNYLAAVPVFRYWDDVSLRQAPLLTDDPDTSYGEGDEDAAASYLVVIGDAREAKIAEARGAYGVSAGNVSTIEGDVITVAATLSAKWAQARDVVVAPYVPSGDKVAAASASYAAALASSLNAPLLYTYTKRTPFKTLAALRRLGAKNVYVVDFGGKCRGGALENLSRENLYLRHTFKRADEVTSFVESHLRKERINTLPRGA